MKRLFSTALAAALMLSPIPAFAEGATQSDSTAQPIEESTHIARVAFRRTGNPVTVGQTGVQVTGWISIDGNTGKILSYGLQDIKGSPTQLSYGVQLSYNKLSATFHVTCWNTAGTVYGEVYFTINSPGPMRFEEIK